MHLGCVWAILVLITACVGCVACLPWAYCGDLSEGASAAQRGNHGMRKPRKTRRNGKLIIRKRGRLGGPVTWGFWLLVSCMLVTTSCCRTVPREPPSLRLDEVLGGVTLGPPKNAEACVRRLGNPAPKEDDIQLTLETVNSSGWKSALTHLRTTKAHVVMVRSTSSLWL